MNNKIFPLFIGTLSILNASCTKELKYSKEQLYSKATSIDSSAQLVLPKSISEGVSCSEYSEGCMSAHIVRVKKLEFIAVEFMSEKDAIYAAKKFRGYYVRNWFLDDVAGEPLLEEFAGKLEAKKP